MEKKADFNLVAKFLLGLSIFAQIMNIINGAIKLDIDTIPGVDKSYITIDIIFSILIIISSILVFLRNKNGLIALILLYIVRIFVDVPTNTSISYAYNVGGNIALFARDFIPFAIAMCFKKDGISGWKAFFISNLSSDRFRTDIDKGQPIPAETKTEDLVNLNEREQIDLADYSNNPTDRGEFNADLVNSIHDLKINNQSSQTRYKEEEQVYEQRNGKRGLFNNITWILIGCVCGLCLIIWLGLVLSSEYPQNIDTLSAKIKYYHSIPNNSLAEEYFAKYQKAAEAGLEEKKKEYLQTAYDAKPSNKVILDSLSSVYFGLALEAKEDTIYYQMAKNICEKSLKLYPNEIIIMDRYSRILYNTDKHEEAYSMAENILQIDPQRPVGIDLLCRKYYYSDEWKNLLKWSNRGLEIDPDSTNFHVEFKYFNSKALYETGSYLEAKRTYLEAEKKTGIIGFIIH